MTEKHFGLYTDLAALTDTMRLEEIARQRQQGVHIPCTDGVLLCPGCKIGKDTLILPGCILFSDARIGERCVVGPNTTLADTVAGDDVQIQSSLCEGATIGNGTVVGPFARLRPGTALGENVRAGNFIEIKNAQVGDGSKVAHLSYVGDCDMGSGVNVGCLCVTANYDGKAKHRTQVGDDVFLGCNTVLVAPVVVGDGAFTAAGTVVTDDVPPEALAIGRSCQKNKEGWQRP